MNMTIYEEETWYDIERNKMHMKKDGEHYVADAMLLRENTNLRQENESLKKENDRLRKERDHWHVEQVHAYGNWKDAHKRASELEAENAKLKRRLEILKSHGIEIADAVAGGFEIYDKEHARVDRLQAENEKLRELIRIVWLAGDFRLFLGVEEIKERMRELGIEVSDVPDDPPRSDAVRRALVRLMDKLGG